MDSLAESPSATQQLSNSANVPAAMKLYRGLILMLRDDGPIFLNSRLTLVCASEGVYVSTSSALSTVMVASTSPPSKSRRKRTKTDSDSDDEIVQPVKRQSWKRARQDSDDRLPGYIPRSYVTKFHGKASEDRDAWLTTVKTSLIRDKVALDGHGHMAASIYLRGEAAEWYESTFLSRHPDDRTVSWDTFVKEFKSRFYQESRQGLALRLAREVVFTDLDSLIKHFANINTLYPRREIIETTYDFVHKLPPVYAALREDLVQHVPRDWQELFVRARAWKGRMSRMRV